MRKRLKLAAAVTLISAVLVAPAASANSWTWPHGGFHGGPRDKGSASGSCDEVSELLDGRKMFLSDLRSDLFAQLPDASRGERRKLLQKIRLLKVRGNLLRVADRRLSQRNLSEKKCELIEAFILRFISYS